MAESLLYGFGLIVIGCVMVWVARPAPGQDIRPWLRVYIVSQVYMLAAMICVIGGAGLLLHRFP